MLQVNQEKVLNILKKPITELPVATDLPRLSNVWIYDKDGTVYKSNTFETIKEKLDFIMTILIRILEGEEKSKEAHQHYLNTLSKENLLSKTLMNEYLNLLGGDSSPSLRLIKCINQSAISAGTIELKMKLGLENMTKDVKGSWYFNIDLRDDKIIEVKSFKRDQCIKNLFQYQWVMTFIFNREDIVCRDVYIEITDIMFSKEVHENFPEKRREIEELIKDYTTEDILKAAGTRYWEHYQIPSNSKTPDLKASIPRETDVIVNGVREYSNGDKYEGQLKNGIRHGEGIYTCHNGTIFKGIYKNGKRHGLGEYIFSGGSKLIGEFADGELITGKYIFPNGDVYEGQFKEFNFNGKGKILSAEGEIYEGEWKCGQRHGYGKIIYPSGDTYEGEWSNGVFCGKGKYKFNNGDYYKGKFKDGLFHGHGEYKYNMKGKKLMGEFENGDFIGKE